MVPPHGRTVLRGALITLPLTMAIHLLSMPAERAARASPLFELAGAVQGDGGFAARAVDAGAANAYFNPALLVDSVAGWELGMFVLAQEIGVTLRGRPTASADIPPESVDMEMPGGGRYPHYGLPTDWLINGKPAAPPDAPLRARPRQSAGSGHGLRTYQVVGLVHRVFGGRLALGFYTMVPYSGFTRAAAFYSDEREQYFSNSLHPELYGDRLTAPSLALGAGTRITERLSVGVGTTLGLHTVASTPTYVSDLGHFENLAVDSEVGVKASLAPHAAIAYQVSSGTALTATVHTPQKLQIDSNFSFLLANGVEQKATIHFTHAYLPWTYAAGVRHDLSRTVNGGVLLTATLRYARWSSYIDRHGEQPDPSQAWYDTAAGTVGVRWWRGGGSMLLDVAYQPSPVPAQTGRTNYVDNDRISAVIGGGYKRPVSLGVLGVHLQVQGHHLLKRTNTKAAAGAAAGGQPVLDEVPDDAVVGSVPVPGREGLQTNNPGWPGFSSAGWVLGMGVAVNLSY